MKDYYRILGIPEDASPDDIKRAFRNLALKYHPDKNPGNEKWAEEKFKEINEADSVLDDSARRHEYDSYRKSPFAGAGRSDFKYSQQEVFRSSFSNPYFYEEINRLFQEMGLRFDQDFLNQVFFNGRGFVFQFFSGPEGIRRQNYHFGGGVPNEMGYTHSSSVTKHPLVTGFLGGIFGWVGRRMMKRLFGVEPAAFLNPDIHQEVKLKRKEAQDGCEKKITYKRGSEKKRLLVKIPAGMKSGTKIRLQGMGLEGARRGDLYLHIDVDGG